MSQFSPEQHQPPAMSPPMSVGDVPAHPTSWPVVFGVIMIVMASMGLLTNVCGGVMSALLPTITAMMPAGAMDDPMMKAQFDIAQRFMPFTIANGVILLTLGVLLLIAGINMVRRRRTAVKLSRIWAIARIVWAIPGAAATHYISNEGFKMMEQAAADSGQPMPTGVMGWMHMIGPVSAVINLVIWCTVPVIVLIWFARQAIKDEVATWP